MRPIKRPAALRLAVVVALALSGGCTTFDRHIDEEPPPPRVYQPTTVPSREVADTETFRGKLRYVFVDLPVKLYDYARGNTPSADAVRMEDSKIPDRRRDGINALVDYSFGKRPPYTTRYRQIAQFDNEALVRATALRALNRARDGTATGVYIDALTDETPQVRLEAAKALANVPNPAAVPALLKTFNDAGEDLDVRIAAADALRQYRTIEVARALVNVLADRQFGLAWQARRSLRAMTGDDRRYDQSAWLQLITGPTNPLG